MLLDGCFLREVPGEHELGLEHVSCLLDSSIQGRGHPIVNGVADMPLDLANEISAAAFVPTPVEVFGDIAKLNDEMLAQVFGLDFAPFLTPKAYEPVFIGAHDDPGI